MTTGTATMTTTGVMTEGNGDMTVANNIGTGGSRGGTTTGMSGGHMASTAPNGIIGLTVRVLQGPSTATAETTAGESGRIGAV